MLMSPSKGETAAHGCHCPRDMAVRIFEINIELVSQRHGLKKILEGTPSPILAGNILNESIPKDEADQLLQDLLHEMNEEGFDEIRFAAYRSAAKLLFVQSKTNLYLVDVFNMIEAFRENGLNTLDHNTELHETRLEAIVSSIFYALNKRLPTTHYIDVERSISLVTNWLLYAYDSDAIGRIRVLSVKTALSTLCAGRLVDKLRCKKSRIISVCVLLENSH
ncbi:unnamed protein product, partial [Porites lobata]